MNPEYKDQSETTNIQLPADHVIQGPNNQVTLTPLEQISGIQPPHKRRSILIVITIVAFLIVAAVIFYFFNHPQSMTATTQSATIQPFDQAKVDKKDFLKGDTLIIGGEGFEINVNSQNRNYTLQKNESCTGYIANARYILINVTVKNITDKTQLFQPFLDVTYTTKSDYAESLSCYETGMPTTLMQRLVSIKPGASVTGDILRAIQPDASDLRLQYTYLFGDGTKFLYTVGL